MFLVFSVMLSSFSFSTPVLGEISGFTQVQAGVQHTLALDSNGSVWSFGLNQFGQVGDGTTSIRPYAVKVKGLGDVKSISAGGMNSAAIKNDGTVWTWGSNFDGELGDGTKTERHTPVQVKGITNVVSVSSGSSHMLALKDDGTVWAWESNQSGKLGNTDVQSHSVTPVQVPGLSDIIAVSAGGFHSLALKSDGTVWSFGSNDSWQLGITGAYFSYTPVQVPGLSNIKSISAGWYFSTALTNDGKVFGWGENICGQLGDGTTNGSHKPVQVPGLDNITQVAASIRSTMALQENGTVWVWGNDWTRKDPSNTFLGYALILNPTPVPGLTNIGALSTGGSYFIVLTDDGKILSWGSNGGQLGDGRAEDQSTPGEVVNTLIFDNTRLSGNDRIETAIAISKKMMPIAQSADTVLLATSQNFPDALAGSVFAGSTLSPIILVDPTEIPEVLKTEYLNSLSSKKIVTLGGQGAVSEKVVSGLESGLR